MKTLKQLETSLYFDNRNEWNAYKIWYKTAIEWILNDVMDFQGSSIEDVQKYLQDLLIK